MALIKVENLTFEYDGTKPAVKGIDLEINAGEFVAIVGRNGSGKSTFAKLLCGLLTPASGHVYIDGEEFVENGEGSDAIRRRIGIVFQNPDNQFVGVSVKDDIAFGLENRNIPREEIISRIDKYSKLVAMNEFLDRNPESLSGGEKQRVAIAGILACETDIIVFDEATSMLDPRGVKEVNEIVKGLKGEKTVLNITHNLNEITYADKVIVMNEGVITYVGTPEEVLENEEVLTNANLIIPDTLKLLNMVKVNKLNKEVEEELCQLIFQK